MHKLCRCAPRIVRNPVLLSIAILALAGFARIAGAHDPLTGDYTREDSLDVRIMAYNTHGDFIANSSADAAFNRILIAIDPDVAVFEEIPSSISESDVANRMNSILPTSGEWDIHFGLLGGIRTVIASRYPLMFQRTDTIPTSSTRGVTIALVNLPDEDYATDVYLMGVHLKCCGDPGGSEDASRQDSADAIANWIADARGVSRPSGNNIILPANTPILTLGDFNLVGGPQPEDTILTGDIQDNGTYGADVKGDWDNTNLTNLNPVDPFTGDNFTWQGSSSFDPSPLDRIFYTDSATTIANSFILNTDTMTSTALANAGLHVGDTLPSSTSDHLPIVVDLRIASPSCPDADGDGVCDPNDLCPGGDDSLDMNSNGVPDACECPGDLDHNFVIDLTDLGILLGNYGLAPATPEEGDVDGDGAVNLTDLGLLLGNFGGACP